MKGWSHTRGWSAAAGWFAVRDAYVQGFEKASITEAVAAEVNRKSRAGCAAAAPPAALDSVAVHRHETWPALWATHMGKHRDIVQPPIKSSSTTTGFGFWLLAVGALFTGAYLAFSTNGPDPWAGISSVYVNDADYLSPLWSLLCMASVPASVLCCLLLICTVPGNPAPKAVQELNRHSFVGLVMVLTAFLWTGLHWVGFNHGFLPAVWTASALTYFAIFIRRLTSHVSRSRMPRPTNLTLQEQRDALIRQVTSQRGALKQRKNVTNDPLVR